MPGTDNQHGSVAVKALAFLPLVLMGAGVWYYLKQHALSEQTPPAPAAVSLPAAAPAEGAKPAVPPGLDAGPVLTLEIQGSPEFKSQVTHALKLIWMADRDTFLSIKNSLYAIRNENKTGFYMDEGRPVAALSNEHAFRSLTWCAGIIAHQAWHASYELGAKKNKNLPPPLPGQKYQRVFDSNPMKFDYKDIKDVLEIEDRASAYQLKILKEVGAPASETGPVFRRAPRDFATGHDGNYTIRP